MRKNDLVIGREYAFPLRASSDGVPQAARLKLLSTGNSGKAIVLVVDPGPQPQASNDPVFERGERKSVRTRRIMCEWENWPDQVAATAMEATAAAESRRMDSAGFEARRADRVRPDPDRLLPELYEEEAYWSSSLEERERNQLAKAYIKCFGLGPFAKAPELIGLVSSLPVMVTRDVLAAGDRRDYDSETVAGVFARAAEVLDYARLNLPIRDSAGRPPRVWHQLITDLELEFLVAVRTHVRSGGGDITMPWVPRLPDWVDEDERDVLKSFGWLRVAMGDTSGRCLHAPGCHTIRSGPASLADHLPLWWVVVEDHKNICAVCGGPGVRDLLELSGFLAAADVWDSRGRSVLERWQIVAAFRLISASAAARAELAEADRTLAGHVVDALSVSQPGDEGWFAYRLITAGQYGQGAAELAGLDPAAREGARVLAHSRLALLAGLLPVGDKPADLPLDATVDQLREQYDWVRRSHRDLPQLDRLLFGLPGAY